MLEVGDPIQVEYDPDSPSRNRVRGDRNLGAVFLVGIGAWVLALLVRAEHLPILRGWWFATRLPQESSKPEA